MGWLDGMGWGGVGWCGLLLRKLRYGNGNGIRVIGASLNSGLAHCSILVRLVRTLPKWQNGLAF